MLVLGPIDKAHQWGPCIEISRKARLAPSQKLPRPQIPPQHHQSHHKPHHTHIPPPPQCPSPSETASFTLLSSKRSPPKSAAKPSSPPSTPPSTNMRTFSSFPSKICATPTSKTCDNILPIREFSTERPKSWPKPWGVPSKMNMPPDLRN